MLIASSSSRPYHSPTSSEMESPFQQYLGMNYVPKVNEEKPIQDLVDRAMKDLRKIDTEIQQVQQQLDLLYEKRWNIKTFADQHQALLSPARKLTQDVIENIFLACIPELPSLIPIYPPMVLTQICSSWRRIALSTPRLWASIHIVLPGTNQGQYPVDNALIIREEQVREILERKKLVVKEWLGRSGACPVSISIDELAEFPNLGNEQFDLAVKSIRQLQLDFFRKAFVPFRPRWYSLDVHVAGEIIDFILDTGLKGESMLKNLHLTRLMDPHTNSRWQYDMKDLLENIPSHVTSVTLHDFPNVSYPSNLGFVVPGHSWARLTELNVNFLDSEMLTMKRSIELASSILQHFPFLVTLKLIACMFGTDDEPDPEIPNDIVLKHLTTFSVVVPPLPCSILFAKRLTLPSIKELSFQFCGYGIGFSSEATAEILKALLCVSEGFTTLALFAPYHWMHSTSDLVNVLKAAPIVKHLTISSNVVNHSRWDSAPPPPKHRYEHILTDELLEALTPGNKDYLDILCPQLEVFECIYELLTGFTETGLKKFATSRRIAHLSDNRISALRRINVFVNDYKRKEVTGEKVFMGAESTVYFRRPDNDLYPLALNVLSDVFNEL